MTDSANQVSGSETAGKITDAAIAKAREMVGVRLRPEGPFIQDATPDTIRNFCNGVGDLNPLYRNAEHGRTSQYASMLAPPLFPMAYGWVGRGRWGFPGVHGFFGGNDWEFFRNVRPGDQISAIERVVGIEEKESRFSGRLVIQYMQAEFCNQRDELVSRVLGWGTRHERKAARDKGKYKAAEPYAYTEEEMERINSAVLNEEANIRGKEPRYWEDVSVGDELVSIARGPLTTFDTIGFLVACGRGHTHGLLMKSAKKHPGHFIKDQESRQAEHTMNVHHRASMAKQAGVPGAIDYGAQRCAWMSTLVTNWMGDAGVLKRLRVELRLPNLIGDTTWCKGKVKGKAMKDGCALVEIEIWAENQKGEITAPNGSATVILPSKNIASRLKRDGTGLDLGYGAYSPPQAA